MNKLFKIDESFSTVGTNKEKGTGLGLSISKSFVNSFGGELSVDSVVGEGSVFFFELEFETCDTLFVQADDEVVSEDEIIKQAKLHVLVAEDNENNQFLIQILLDKIGVASVIVENGQEAIDEYNKEVEENGLILQHSRMF